MDNRQKMYAGIGVGLAAFAAIAYMAYKSSSSKPSAIPAVTAAATASTTKNQHEDINIAEFLSVCIYLSEECGKVIRQVEESGEH